MTSYKDIVDEFFTRYEHPVIEPFIMGFSGIDPPLKCSTVIQNHEALDNLLGGEAYGHFHLTKEQLDWIIENMNEKFPPSITPHQVIYATADDPISDYLILGNDVR